MSDCLSFLFVVIKRKKYVIRWLSVCEHQINQRRIEIRLAENVFWRNSRLSSRHATACLLAKVRFCGTSVTDIFAAPFYCCMFIIFVKYIRIWCSWINLQIFFATWLVIKSSIYGKSLQFRAILVQRSNGLFGFISPNSFLFEIRSSRQRCWKNHCYWYVTRKIIWFNPS